MFAVARLLSYRYRSIAVGGTFDHIHMGHRALLARAFELGKTVYIGLTSDEFAKSFGKKILHNYEERYLQLWQYVEHTFPGRKYYISRLKENFGPAVLEGEIGAIIVSEETKFRVAEANVIRRSRGLRELQMEVVPMIPAYDGRKISSSRIRSGEIDAEGKPARRAPPPS